MNGHTPGDWMAERDPCHFDTLSTVTAGDNGRMVVQIGGNAKIAEQEANARLVAAAPELLAACELVAQSALRNLAYDRCLAAIAKALGA